MQEKHVWDQPTDFPIKHCKGLCLCFLVNWIEIWLLSCCRSLCLFQFPCFDWLQDIYLKFVDIWWNPFFSLCNVSCVTGCHLKNNIPSAMGTMLLLLTEKRAHDFAYNCFMLLMWLLSKGVFYLNSEKQSVSYFEFSFSNSVHMLKKLCAIMTPNIIL